MNRSTFTLAAVALTATLATAAWAGGRDMREHGGPEGEGMMVPGMPPPLAGRIADELDLTAEQRQSIKDIFAKARPQFQELRETMRENAERLRKTAPDAADYDKVVSQVRKSASELAGKMVTQGSEIRSRVWTVLTPEQRKKLPELEAQMRDKFRERMHDRFEHRDHTPSPAETPPT